MKYANNIGINHVSHHIFREGISKVLDFMDTTQLIIFIRDYIYKNTNLIDILK